MLEIIEKKCTKCGLIKSLDSFCNDKKGKYAKKSQCKECDKKYKEVYKIKHNILQKSKQNNYTKQELVSELQRFVKENNRNPKCQDMKVKDGYPSYNVYINMFGDWKTVLIEAGIYKEHGYTKEELIQYLYNYIEEYGKIPSSKNLGRKYPSSSTYMRVFGSWNNTLLAAGLGLYDRRNIEYTEQELINSINLFINKNGRSPKECEMRLTDGYIPTNRYIKLYGSWPTAMKKMGFDPLKMCYTKEELIDSLHKFVNEFNRLPFTSDFKNNSDYPSWNTYATMFGSWNNALIEAGYEPEYIYHKHSGEIEYCYNCRCAISNKYRYDENDNVLCDKCCQSDRKFLKGVLDPNCTTAMGIITEHVVFDVLNDCVKCNTIENFNNKYDLISEKYGIINVKSVKLSFSDNYYWKFDCEGIVIPDYYICFGMNIQRTEILHTWIIPSNSKIVAKTSITISLGNLKRASQYEVDPTPYNEAYQNLDIYTLPEFCNLPRDDILHRVPSEDMIKC